jgi:hypothetical protein
MIHVSSKKYFTYYYTLSIHRTSVIQFQHNNKTNMGQPESGPRENMPHEQGAEAQDNRGKSREKKEKTPDTQLQELFIKKQSKCQQLLDKESVEEMVENKIAVLSNIKKNLEAWTSEAAKKIPDGAITNIPSYLEYTIITKDAENNEVVLTLRFHLSASKKEGKLNISIIPHEEMA